MILTDDEAERMIACMPHDGKHAPGGVLRLARCGHQVWISRAGQRAVERGRVPVCVKCALALTVARGGPVELVGVPGALDELEEIYGPARRARLEARWRARGVRMQG